MVQKIENVRMKTAVASIALDFFQFSRRGIGENTFSLGNIFGGENNSE